MDSDGIGEFVEIFCGIGGFAEAVGGSARIHSAVDINRNALDIYRLNFAHPTLCKTIESLSPLDTLDWADKNWWMSPPCQPHTRRGRQNDIDDSRSLAFLNVLKLIKAHQPPAIALENVPAFAKSQGHAQLTADLRQLGYCVRETTICPTQFGIRNNRKRFYLIAARTGLIPWQTIARVNHPQTRLESEPDPKELTVAASITERYSKSMDVVALDDSKNTACFTSAYGRSHIRSGSYLSTSSGLRRFSPREILWQLGFGGDFVLPDWPYEKLWPLVGNSLSIPVIRYVVSHLQLDRNAHVTTWGIGSR